MNNITNCRTVGKPFLAMLGLLAMAFSPQSARAEANEKNCVETTRESGFNLGIIYDKMTVKEIVCKDPPAKQDKQDKPESSPKSAPERGRN